MGMDTGTVGARVRELRQERGWSLRQLAERAGVSHQYVDVLEKGQRGRLNADMVRKLADALEVPLAVLLGLESPAGEGVDEEMTEFIRELVLLTPDERALTYDFVRLLRFRSSAKRKTGFVGRVLGQDPASAEGAEGAGEEMREASAG